jgi:hypothetical protein
MLQSLPLHAAIIRNHSIICQFQVVVLYGSINKVNIFSLSGVENLSGVEDQFRYQDMKTTQQGT